MPANPLLQRQPAAPHHQRVPPRAVGQLNTVLGQAAADLREQSGLRRVAGPDRLPEQRHQRVGRCDHVRLGYVLPNAALPAIAESPHAGEIGELIAGQLARLLQERLERQPR